MSYPEFMIRPMREELTRLGVEELRTPEAVDEGRSVCHAGCHGAAAAPDDADDQANFNRAAAD